MRRVVVTGLGLVTPLATGVEETWSRLLAGQSGAGPITRFDTTWYATTYACEVKRGDGTDGTFNPDDWMEPKEQRKVDEFILYGMAAADQAIKDAGWTPSDTESLERTGCLIGSGIGGLSSIADTSITLNEKGPRRVSPFFVPGALINLISGQVSIRYGFKGPNHAVVTACSTGAHAIGDAARLIMLDDADVMVAGGAESPICAIGIAGFNACKALSTKRGHEPEKASRPWDSDSDGFVMGEGAGMVVLEEYEHAKARGATIYAEILGYGLSGDAYHITAPPPDHEGAERAMRAALKRAGLSRRISTMSTRMAPRPWPTRSSWRGGAADGRSCREADDVLDQVDDGPPSGGGGRDRGDLRHPRDARPDRAADDQPRQSGGGDPDQPVCQCRAEG
jgi:3-oxoacyl-[acyl-carrier-protein] synthase II